MKIVKRLLTVLLCLSLVATFFMGFSSVSRQNNSGANSSVTTITEADRAWIIDHFGGCSDIECLMLCVEDYAVQNLRYDYDKSTIFQHFDFYDTVDSGKGICFDFACFFKNCCKVWAEHNGIDLEVYVVNIKYKHKSVFASGHSYSVVLMPDGKNYYIDVTNSINEVQVKKNPAPGFEVFYESIEDYAARYNERVFGLR